MRENSREWTWTLAAFDGDAVMAGFIAMRDQHVDQLYVDPSHQRMGVGSALLGEAVAAAPGRITLDVSKRIRPLAHSTRSTAFSRATAG